MSDSEQKSPISAGLLECLACIFFMIFLLLGCSHSKANGGCEVNGKDQMTSDYENDGTDNGWFGFGLF